MIKVAIIFFVLGVVQGLIVGDWLHLRSALTASKPVGKK